MTEKALITSKKAVLLCHGFSASAFEWLEFKAHLEANLYPGKIVLVPMAGHDRDSTHIQERVWQDWGAAILNIYRGLSLSGYTQIDIAATSTSCALILHFLATHQTDFAPKNIFFIDPFIYPNNKALYLLSFLPRSIHFVINWGLTRTKTEKAHWINFVPSESLYQLNQLRKTVIRELKNGLTLSSSTYLKVFRSTHDPVVSPKTVEFIRQHVKTHSGESIPIQYFESSHHVLTRGSGRANWSELDEKIQIQIFDECLRKMS